MWAAHMSIHENTCSTHCVCGGDVKATGLLYKRILCSIIATHKHTHAVYTHQNVDTLQKKHECSMHMKYSRERLLGAVEV